MIFSILLSFIENDIIQYLGQPHIILDIEFNIFETFLRFRIVLDE